MHVKLIDNVSVNSIFLALITKSITVVCLAAVEAYAMKQFSQGVFYFLFFTNFISQEPTTKKSIYGFNSNNFVKQKYLYR